MIHLGDITKINGAEIPIVDVITGGSPYKIYMHIFPDGKRYVGMTKNSIQTRKNDGYQHNKGIRDAIKRYGWGNVKTEIISEGLSFDDACVAEQQAIAEIMNKYPEKCLNISKGGKATFKGLHHTEKHKKHMSELYKGKVFSEETLQKLRDGHASERKPVKRICNGTIIVYKSLGDAAIAVNGYKSNISRACQNNKTYKDSKWEFV